MKCIFCYNEIKYLPKAKVKPRNDFPPPYYCKQCNATFYYEDLSLRIWVYDFDYKNKEYCVYWDDYSNTTEIDIFLNEQLDKIATLQDQVVLGPKEMIKKLPIIIVFN